VVDRGVAIFDEPLLACLRRTFVDGGGGFGHPQGELAALPMWLGGLRVPRGQDNRKVAFLSAALQIRQLQEEI
jgi:hypothetical protein